MIASIDIENYLIPQPDIDSQKISHFSTGIGSNTKTHNSTKIKRIILVSLDSQTQN